MRIIFAIAAMLTASSCAAAGPTERCQPLGASYRVYGPQLSIPQIEKIGVELAAENPAAPQVPFAFGNKNWQELKALYQAGDAFRAFDGPRWTDSDLPIAGGYMLLRGNCVIGQMATWRS